MTAASRQGTTIMEGLRFLKRDNPWPEFGYGEHRPFELALDGNGRAGRELVVDLIVRRDITLMVEVGCFLCGSALQWLRASQALTVIGLDPWDGNWSAYLERLAVDPVQSRSVWHFSDEEIARIADSLRRYGNFATAMNNVRLYKERFIPVRQRSPEGLRYLHERAIRPQLIYIDADKQADDLEVAHALFPDAVLCGDDWLWPDAAGKFVMQEAVKAFAARHGMTVEAKRQTCVLQPAP